MRRKLYDTKGVIRELEELAAVLQDGNWISLPNGLRMDKVLHTDVCELILHLAAADGSIAANEETLFQILSGYTDSAASMIQYIRSRGLAAADFSSRIPDSARLLTEAANNYYRANPEARELMQTMLSNYLMALMAIGLQTVRSDTGSSPEESRRLSAFMTKVLAHINTASLVPVGMTYAQLSAQTEAMLNA